MEHQRIDTTLVARAANGDQEAFRQIMTTYKTQVLVTASRFARQKHDLDDLAQEIFLRVWKGLPGYRREAPFEHWLMRVAIRTCYDFAKREKKRRQREISSGGFEWNRPEEEALPADTTHAIQDSGEYQRELAEVLHHAMAKLDAADRTVLTLLELEERTVKEIAAGLGWGESKVKTRAHRARKKLARILKKDGWP